MSDFWEVADRIVREHEVKIDRPKGSMRRESDGSQRIDFFLTCDRWEGSPVNAEPEKCDAIAWVRIKRPPSNTIPYIRRALTNFAAGRAFDEFADPPALDRPGGRGPAVATPPIKSTRRRKP